MKRPRVTAAEVATQAAAQHHRDANYHRICGHAALAAMAEETGILLDRIARLIDQEKL